MLKRFKVFTESMQRHCAMYQCVDNCWYMDLADEEYGEYQDSTCYGPFRSKEATIEYLNHFSNPGGWQTPDKKQPVPKKSGNGRPVVRPDKSY